MPASSMPDGRLARGAGGGAADFDEHPANDKSNDNDRGGAELHIGLRSEKSGENTQSDYSPDTTPSSSVTVPAW